MTTVCTTVPEPKQEFCLKNFDLSCGSDFVPSGSFPAIDTFFNLVRRDLDRLKEQEKSNKLLFPNMSKSDLEAVQQLGDNNSIVIRQADKGGAVVVWNKCDYINEAMSQLNDTDVYRRLDHDPKFAFIQKIKDVVESAVSDNLIDTDLAKFLMVEHPRTPLLYLLPKIHKSLQQPPGRPIVSGRDSLLSHVSIFLDRALRHFAISSSSYIQDTADFITKISQLSVPQGSLLASFDVQSLYTSIDHERGIAAINRKLDTMDWSPQAKQFIIDLLTINLTCNYFMFNNEYFLQIRGTAMGANVAPIYANVFVADLEERFIYPSDMFSKVSCWYRYIDDIFLIWSGTEHELVDFRRFLNTLDPDLKFTLLWSKLEIQFLDTTVFFEGDSLSTKLYRKPTDRNTLLKYDSCHPRNMVKSLPYSQMLRARRVVAKEDTFISTLDEMTNLFRERGYPSRVIQGHRDKVEHMDRTGLLLKKTSTRQNKRVPFVTTYTDYSRSISKIVNTHWPMIRASYPQVKDFESPPLFSYRRKRNLKDVLVKNDIGRTIRDTQSYLTTRKFGTFPCLGCVNCRLIQKGDTFNHPTTGHEYRITQFFTCDSDWVVYLLKCPCDLLYVGETTCTLKVRLNGHRHAIRKKRMDLPVSRHFIEAGHSEWDLKVRIIDRVPNPPRGGNRIGLLKRCELKWIYMLGTLHPGGLNIDFKVNREVM